MGKNKLTKFTELLDKYKEAVENTQSKVEQDAAPIPFYKSLDKQHTLRQSLIVLFTQALKK